MNGSFVWSPKERNPSVGEPPLIHASALPKSIAPVFGLRPVAKPRPKSLSRNAQRKTQPIAMRRIPQKIPPLAGASAPPSPRPLLVPHPSVLPRLPIAGNVLGTPA